MSVISSVSSQATQFLNTSATSNPGKASAPIQTTSEASGTAAAKVNAAEKDSCDNRVGSRFNAYA